MPAAYELRKALAKEHRLTVVGLLGIRKLKG